MPQLEQSKIENTETRDSTKSDGGQSPIVDSTGGQSDAGQGGNDAGNIDLREASIPEWRNQESEPGFDDDSSNSENGQEIDLSKENFTSIDSVSRPGSFAETQNFDNAPNKLDSASDELREQFQKSSEGTVDSAASKTDEGTDSPAPTPPDYNI